MGFKELILSEEARLLFGKKEQEIINKQLEGIRLNQTEKNVLSRNIRKKLKFVEKISKFKEEFKLERNQENKKLIQKAINLILKDEFAENVSAILLFGSFADGTNIFRSDIDICVLFNKNFSSRELFDFKLRILANFSLKLDLQIFNVLPRKIQRSIVLNHKVLYKNKDFDAYRFFVENIKKTDYDIRMQKFFGAET